MLKSLLKKENDLDEVGSIKSDRSLDDLNILDVSRVLIHRKDGEARKFWKLFKLKARMNKINPL